jgi:peptide/nickel transport system substrate-binding protein
MFHYLAHRARRVVLGLGALALVAVGLAGCRGADAGASAVTLRVAATASGPFTDQFNPLLDTAKGASGYSTLIVYEPLMMDDFVHATTKPWLATSYQWSDRGRTLTIHLRPNVKWSDGTPLTGDDVAYTFDLMIKHAALNFYGLPLSGASAPDATTTVVHFKRSGYQYLWWYTTPVPKHVWQPVKDPVTFTNQHPVGTGPFVLKTFTPQAITFTRNTNYWGTAPHVQTVQYLAYDSDSSMVAALEGGQVDWITTSTSDPKRIAQSSPTKIGYWVTVPSPAKIYLFSNDAQAPTRDVTLRRAMSEAIDRTQISTVAFNGQNTPLRSPTGLDLDTQSTLIAPAYRDLSYGAADPSAAKRLLLAAGYKAGSNGMLTTPSGSPLSLTITVPSSNPYGDWVRAGLMIATQLKAAGIGTTVKTESETAWREDVNLGNFQLTLRASGGILPLFDMYNRIFDQKLAPVGTKANTNFERYSNPDARAALLSLANSSAGSRAELSALGRLEKLMVDQVPIIPLFHVTGIGMWLPDRFSGWPGANNSYAVPTGTSINAVEVMTTVQPLGK